MCRQFAVEGPDIQAGVGCLPLELIPLHEYRHISGAQAPVAKEGDEVRPGRIASQQFFGELSVQVGLVKNPRRIRSARFLDDVSQSLSEPPTAGRPLSNPVARLDERRHRKHEPLACLSPPVKLGSYFAGLLLAV